ncbi:MAG: FHA domain-containing protein [Aggregatilineales bacterium]
MMTHERFSADAESILQYLLATRTQVKRTKQAIRESCQLAQGNRIDEALRQLLAAGVVSDLGDNVYELTASGREYARQRRESGSKVTTFINTVEAGGKVNVSAVQDLTATPLSYESLVIKPEGRPTGLLREAEESETERTLGADNQALPSYQIHPLRFTAALIEKPSDPPKKAIARTTPVCFLLAFETSRDALPVPVIDGDVLGRDRSTNIWLRHDRYLSSRHCQFHVKFDRVANAWTLFVEDLKSRNGTYVNDRKLTPNKKFPLKHGAHLQVGSSILIVVEIPR